MMLFRSARDSDLDAIHQLAEISGVGMTTLPKDKELLKNAWNGLANPIKEMSLTLAVNIIFLSWKNKK